MSKKSSEERIKRLESIVVANTLLLRALSETASPKNTVGKYHETRIGDLKVVQDEVLKMQEEFLTIIKAENGGG